mmetsp:Transcript_9104/g.33595  ORF Transcript_9104/g.33595 Transcript_9104/m.33595 type:complete len:221 (+) Transcript_9104:7332-7994(+)
METLLESPETEMREAVLNLLHSWILHVDLRHSVLYTQSRLLSLVTALINQRELHEKATKVLDVAVRIACKDVQGDLTLMSKSPDAPVTLKSIPTGLQLAPHQRLAFTEAPGNATKTGTIAIIESMFVESKAEKGAENLLLLLDHYQGGNSSSGESRTESSRGDLPDATDSDVTDSTETDVDLHTMSRSFKIAHDERMEKKIGLFEDLLRYEMNKMQSNED